HVTLYEISNQALLEVDRAVHTVESPVAGRVIESRLALGREVIAGEVLLRLNAMPSSIRFAKRTRSWLHLNLSLLLCTLRVRASSRRGRKRPAPLAQRH